MTLKVLFVCTANVDRSPTAEALFRGHPGVEVASAGTARDAVRPLTSEIIARADLIIVMEEAHREAINARFATSLKAKHIVSLDIPDHYKRGDPELVKLLEARVPGHLPSG